MAIKVETRRMRLADLRPQKVNARFMTPSEFQQLVANIRKDGCLTSVPLGYEARTKAPVELLSGHHRVKAAMEALGDDVEADVMVIQGKQSLAELRARQLSHNSIVGHDDLATLRRLYDEIDDIDWREYAGLDDKTLALLEDVDLSSLGEATLDFLTVQILFLPHEVERAKTMLDTVTAMLRPDERWLAQEKDWDRLVDQLETARGATNVVNSAAAFSVILDVVEEHLEDLAHGWFDVRDGSTRHDKWVPVETITGSRSVPPEAGAVMLEAMTKARAEGDLDDDAPAWRLLELICADYLAGP